MVSFEHFTEKGGGGWGKTGYSRIIIAKCVLQQLGPRGSYNLPVKEKTCVHY